MKCISLSQKKLHVKKLAINKKSTFFVLSLCNFVKKNYLMSLSFLQSFMRIEPKLCNFYWWPIFEHVLFFLTQTLYQENVRIGMLQLSLRSVHYSVANTKGIEFLELDIWSSKTRDNYYCTLPNMYSWKLFI